jgi:RNA-binding protein YlmH
MTKDELITARIEDKIAQCRDGYYVTSTGLLDTHEQALAIAASRHAAGVRTFMYGGYDEAERRMLVCVPRDIPMDDEEAVEGLLRVLRVKLPTISRELSHRDYLGSLLGLGIDRRLTGDILVRPDGADIFIVPGIEEFLLKELHRIGPVEVKTEAVPVEELIVPEARVEFIKDSLSSVRLDSVVSSAFRISRGKAAEAVRKGLVSVDHAECIKPDAAVHEGASIVLKGKGKAVLEETGGESRKGRIRIVIKRYI